MPPAPPPALPLLPQGLANPVASSTAKKSSEQDARMPSHSEGQTVVVVDGLSVAAAAAATDTRGSHALQARRSSASLHPAERPPSGSSSPGIHRRTARACRTPQQLQAERHAGRGADAADADAVGKGSGAWGMPVVAPSTARAKGCGSHA
jgi:hypothetical protein